MPRPEPGPAGDERRRAQELTDTLREALESANSSRLRELCTQASKLTGSTREHKELRTLTAVARSRLQHPERHAALAELRRTLADLAAQPPATLAGEEIATKVDALERWADTAGGLLTQYDRTAIAAWRKRLQNGEH